jgi:hypothetical protein
MSNCARGILGAVTILMIVAATALLADAALVSGVYVNSAGTPLPDHQLHFQNRVSGDMYLARSGSDGSFSADLPPGIYDLRGERGLEIREAIVVENSPLSIGKVKRSTMLSDVLRAPFERQGIAPTLVNTDAPATAHVAHAASAAPGSPSYWTPATPAAAASPGR